MNMKRLKKFKSPSIVKLKRDCYRDLVIYSRNQKNLYISKVNEFVSSHMLQAFKPRAFIEEGSITIRILANCPIHISGDLAPLLLQDHCLEKQVGSSLLAYCVGSFNKDYHYLPADII